jgi:hypothetical protein
MAIPLLAASMASVVYLAGPAVRPLLAADAVAVAPTDSKEDLSIAIEHQKRREESQKQLLKTETDASGQVRPDLWRQGVAHQKQMKVAPFIGAKPSGVSGAPKKAH